MQAIQKRFVEEGWTLALAESCTGGGLAAALVALPDSSLYFQGGCVAYSNRAKEKILHVDPQTLLRYGAVSEETAREMAQSALEIFETDFALATTGVAGPKGGSSQKPVGMICFAILSLEKEPITWTAHFKGDRGAVIEKAIADALEHLRDYIV